MCFSPLRRRGFSLIELLVVIAILTVFLGLTLAAIQRTRQAAIRIKCMNQLRQISLALTQFTSDQDGALPSVESAISFRFSNSRGNNFLGCLLPYLEGGTESAVPRSDTISLQNGQWRRIFLSPVDPTAQLSGLVQNTSATPSSYSANMTAFVGFPRLPQSFPDGTSTTLAYAERYCRIPTTDTIWIYDIFETTPPLLPGIVGGPRRATFADEGWKDVVPVTTGDPPVTRASVPGATFQLRPKLEHADARQLQALQPSGLLAAWFDGSVRLLPATIEESVFWSQVTRAGGEIVSD